MGKFENVMASQTDIWEGGYANNPQDKGGETFRGISRFSWPGWVGWKPIDEFKKTLPVGLPVSALAKAINKEYLKSEAMNDMVIDFYRKNFWDYWTPLKAPENVHAKLFDMSVNIGTDRISKFLQRAISKVEKPISVDGDIGPNTKAAALSVWLSTAKTKALIESLVDQQKAHYIQWSAKYPYWSKRLPNFLQRAEYRGE